MAGVHETGSTPFRLAWRQWELAPDGTRRRKQRTVTAYSIEERKRLEVEIEKAVAERGWWTPETPGAMPAESNLEQIALEWVRWKVGLRGVARNTQKNLAGSMNRFFTGVRAILGLAKEEVVPASVMSVRLVTEVIGWWRTKKKYAESTIYQSGAAVFVSDPADPSH